MVVEGFHDETAAPAALRGQKPSETRSPQQIQVTLNPKPETPNPKPFRFTLQEGLGIDLHGWWAGDKGTLVLVGGRQGHARPGSQVAPPGPKP